MTVETQVRYRAIARIQNNGNTEAFIFEASNNSIEYETYRRATEIVASGLVENLRITEVNTENGKSYTQIRGLGCNLTKIPTYSSLEHAKQIYGKRLIVPTEYYLTGLVRNNTGKVIGYKMTETLDKTKSQFMSEYKIKGYIMGALVTNLIIDDRGQLQYTGDHPERLAEYEYRKDTGSIVPKTPGKGKNLFRYYRLKSSGRVIDTTTKKEIHFKATDYLLIKENGDIVIVQKQKFEDMFKPYPDRTQANSDNSLGEINKYIIEFLGSNPFRMNEQNILGFTVAKRVK